MENFDYFNPTKIIFGKDTEQRAGKETIGFGKKVLLHYGGGSIKKYGLYDKIIRSLENEKIEILELGGVKPNPRLSLVREGIKICRKENIEFILAVGGGSVIDSAKAIAAGVPYQGDVWDFFSKKAVIKESIPLGVILTIPAAGSEVSQAVVITNEEGWYKRDAVSDSLRPKFSVLNPEISSTLSARQTVTGVADIMAHVFERYFTQVKNVELTDRLSEATLKTVINNTRLLLTDLQDYNYRAEIMWAGSIAHNNLLSTGRIGDWASHGIEHELSAIYDISHGDGLAIIIPAWMKYVYKLNIERFAQVAVRVWNIDLDFYNPEKTALEGIKRLENFFLEIGLPTRLNDIKIGDDKFEEMAAKCTENGPIGQFRKLYKEDIVKIYELAMD